MVEQAGSGSAIAAFEGIGRNDLGPEIFPDCQGIAEFDRGLTEPAKTVEGARGDEMAFRCGVVVAELDRQGEGLGGGVESFSVLLQAKVRLAQGDPPGPQAVIVNRQ